MPETDLDPQWLAAFATRLGVAELSEETVNELLSLAGRAAHDSGDRRNAPLACFMVGLAIGVDGEEVHADVVGRFSCG